MPDSVEFITGPLVSEFTREAAEEALRRNPKIASGNASYALDSVEGRWVAAIVVEADSPFGGPADQDEQAPGPKSEGPDDTANEDPSGPPSPEGDSESPDGPPGMDGPPSDSDSDSDSDSKNKKGGDKELLHQIVDAISQIGQALGVPINLGGPDGGPDDPGMGGPLGPGGPDNAPPPPPGLGAGGPGPSGPPSGPGGPGIQTIHHEKALKPGEVPPGGTPIGAPAFSHVREDHPWKRTVGKVASFSTENAIGDRSLTEVYSELQSLASELGGGYKIAKLEESYDDNGNRLARAVVSLH